MTEEKTIGQLVQELIALDIDMWNNQEFVYEIRRMSFDEYKEKYFADEEGAEKMWSFLKKACDLNVSRNDAMDALDTKIAKIVSKEKA